MKATGTPLKEKVISLFHALLPGRKTSPFILSALFFFVSFSSCSEKTETPPEDPCGNIDEWYSNLSIDDHFTTSEILSGGRITYFFEDISTPTDICPDHHIQCHWLLEPVSLDEDTSILDLKGKVYWNGLQGQVVNVGWNDDETYYEFEDIGLKMAYGDKPAWIGMNFQVTFYDRGSVELNKAFLKSKITEFQVKVIYKKYKG